MGVGADETEQDRIAKQLAVASALAVEKELPKAAEMFKKAVIHNPTPMDVVAEVVAEKSANLGLATRHRLLSPTHRQTLRP